MEIFIFGGKELQTMLLSEETSLNKIENMNVND